ncbi:MAG: NAD(P)-binding protein, partial [Pseudomonadota bacterium]
MDRRDFLNGVAVAIGAGALTSVGIPVSSHALAPDSPAVPHSNYPPGLVGMRGSNDGSFDVMHSIAWGGKRYGRAGTQVDSRYDLVVVGAGLSGLAAARYFQQANPDARILILDNHDDFGGHARRNEFTVDGQHLLGHGGSQSIDTPSMYSAEAKALLEDIGIATERFYDYYDRDFYASHDMAMGLFLAEEHFGTDHLQRAPVEMFGGFGLMFGAAGMGNDDALIETLPISPADKTKLRELIFEANDYLPDLSKNEKEQLLKTISYAEYLSTYTGASDDVIKLLDDTLKQLYALNWRALPAIQAIDLMMPGMQAFEFGSGKLVRRAAQARSLLPLSVWSYLSDKLLAQADMEPYIFHFPDGN